MKDEKILENEILSDEDLKRVAGGSVGKTAFDSTLLYAYGLLDDYHGVMHTIFHWGSDSAAVDDGWRKAGITCVTNPLDTNQYFINGKEISADEAAKHLKSNFKQIREIPEIPF